jgi:hypothetical protein
VRLEIKTMIAIAIATVTPFASGSADPIACEDDGIYDGKNNPYSPEFYEMCGQIYYDALIEGCMAIENNTREVCESATDAE